MELAAEVVAKLKGNDEEIRRKKQILQAVVDGLNRGGKAQVQIALNSGRQALDSEFSLLLSKIRRMI